jgi:hypothetical protein
MAASGAEEHHWVDDQGSGKQSPQSNRWEYDAVVRASALL